MPLLETVLHFKSTFRQYMSKDHLDGDGLIVSLTSYPPRFKKLTLVLESLFGQSLKPGRIYLCIAEEDKQHLPSNVAKLVKYGLEIDYYSNIRSYKKLIPCLRKHPDAIIVTADDDVIYPFNWLQALYREHQKHPAEVICHRARMMTFNSNGLLGSYKTWPNLTTETSSLNVFPVGVGGVLYPPGCFSRDVYDQDQFMNLAPHGDDIWFKAMSLIHGTPCRKISFYKKNFHELKESQQHALRKENVSYRNDEQIDQVFSHYSLNSRLQAEP